ncbi:MAG: ADP-ribosylglycohydrolase family protein [Alphaproteobacteria bacterium]|nr:ADP-ribosylglycohydrolase family protein [Alphaproteobacteria bacterium]
MNKMLGAIIGDIIGSPYEFHNIKTKEFPLFCDKCCFTDDTILTCATAEWLLSNKTPEEMLLKWGKRYQNRTYEDGKIGAFGKGFSAWLETQIPYNAKTNGCIMRLSPIFTAFKDKDEALETAIRFTKITHNHEESLIATRAYIETGFLLKDGVNPKIIKNYIGHKYQYDLSSSLDDIRPNYNKFYCSCKNSVPQALIAALDADSYEDALRNAVSIGGDSDTLAAMAGGLAEIRFGIPQNIQEEAKKYMDNNILSVTQKFYQTFQKDNSILKRFLTPNERI